MKQNMTEAEREAQRIRRVLANRESARQTIRRRQALREGLIKRVADLSLDNESMKMKKELVMKEYLSLKDRNKELKEQVAQAMKMKSDVEHAAEIPPTSPSTELSLAPPNWSSRIKWDPCPSISSDGTACYEEGCSSRAGESRTFPLLQQTYETNPTYCKSFSDRFAETDVLEEDKNDGINLVELPIGFDGKDKILIHDPGGEIKGERELCVKVDKKVRDQGDMSITLSAEVASFIPQVKKLADPTAAAAARKRRKEIIKLKSLHGK